MVVELAVELYAEKSLDRGTVVTSASAGSRIRSIDNVDDLEMSLQRF